jgi:hypothetical protein
MRTAAVLCLALADGGSASAPGEAASLDAAKALVSKVVAALEAVAKAEGREAQKILLPDTFSKVSPRASFP